MMVQGKLHPWLGLTLAIIGGALLLVLLLKPGGEAQAPTPVAPAATQVNAPDATIAPAVQAKPTEAVSALSSAEIEKFRATLRRANLAGRYGRLAVSPAARALFLAGKTREAAGEAVRELRARIAHDDRDATAAFYQAMLACNAADPAAIRREFESGDVHIAEKAPRQSPANRLRTEAALAVAREQMEFDEALCEGGAADNNAALLEKVRNAASDGDLPSLMALADAAHLRRDYDGEERRLLSAALLGDPDGQWQLALFYRNRWSTSSEVKDRDKMKFWLEQAAEKIPAAAFALGECLQSGCDGRPPNPGRARSLVESAARKGDSAAIEAMITAGADPATGDRFDEYAWLDFRARLAEDGCHPSYYLDLFDDPRGDARARFLTGDLTEADRRAQSLYESAATDAHSQLGCK